VEVEAEVVVHMQTLIAVVETEHQAVQALEMQDLAVLVEMEKELHPELLMLELVEIQGHSQAVVVEAAVAAGWVMYQVPIV
jgi:hypothetical protein